MLKQTAVLYSDGACSPNPGVGGYGAIFTLESDGKKYIKKFSRAYRQTTNNRMELLGIIEPLEFLKKDGNKSKEVTVVTDSQYVANSINKGWLKGWIKKGLLENDEDKPANKDLWKRMIVLLEHFNITFKWIRGHNGHSENEECDRLAVDARSNSSACVDKNYEAKNAEK